MSARIVIVHGFGINVDHLFSRPVGDNVEFSVFDEMLDSGEAKIFRWDLAWRFKSWDYVNPLKYFEVYTTEREVIAQEGLYTQLDEFLQQQQPEIVLTHSMGAEILVRYLEKHQLPGSVQKLVTVQADISPEVKVVESLDVPSKVSWHNIYCWWDPALIVSSLWHVQPRAGLVGWRSDRVENHFLPLHLGPNIHLSSMNDPALLTFLD